MSYSSRPLSSKLFQLTALTLALTLAGCGGGDGTDVVAPTPDIGVQPDGSGNTDNAIRAVNVSPITLTDSSGSPTRIITSTGATASVKITDAENKPISSALVTFNTDAPMSSVKFANTNGTVLTNANGVATMKLSAISATDTGSYVLTATANYNDTERQGASYFYSLQEANLIFDKVKVDENTLPYGGSTDITGLVKDSASLESQRGIEIGFEASCGSVSDTTTNILGFRTTYNAETCEGPQTVVATIKENNTSIRLPITVNQSTNLGALSIKCISGDTPQFPDSSADGSGADQCANAVPIGAINQSDRPSQRTVEFVVSKNDGQPFAYESVKVELLNAPNDFSFGSMSNRAPKTYKTNSEGVIKVPLYAGTEIDSGIKLRATLISRADVTATFSNISVVGNTPTQGGFELIASKNVLAATSTDDSQQQTRLNDATKINVTLRDSNGQFINGSTVHFVTEGGTLSSNTCMVRNGGCSVTLSTKGVLPDDRRITILAYSDNEDGASSSEVFLDENENGKLDNNEFVVDSTSKYIFKQIIMGFADTTPVFTKSMEGDVLTANVKGTSQYKFKMLGTSSQTKNISMPSGTKVSVNAIDNTRANEATCNAQLISKGNIGTTLVVPDIVDLYTPDKPSLTTKKQDDSDKTYVIRTQQCAKGDKVSLIVTTPAPNRKVTTKELEFK